MQIAKNYIWTALYFFTIILLCGCGGGGGGSSGTSTTGTGTGTDTGGSTGSGSGGTAGTGVKVNTPPVAHADLITTDEDNTITFNPLVNDADVDIADTITITGIVNGSKGIATYLGSIVTYVPNLDANGTDELTYTISDGQGGTSTGSITIIINPIDDAAPIAPTQFLPGVFPSLVDGYFIYTNGGQKYSSTGMPVTQAIGVASFQNGTLSVGEGNIVITNSTASLSKSTPSTVQTSDLLLQKNSKFSVSKYLENSEELKASLQKGKNLKNSQKSNRASDALGTREAFYISDTAVPGNQTFQKIYSGSKCLIYSAVEPAFNLPYVTEARGKVIGDAFEVSNPFHPTGKSIFDVDTANFGNPWGIDESGNIINGGGRDGEKQTLLLLYDNGTFSDDGLYGYFYPLDEDLKGTKSSNGDISNGAEIIYINKYWAEDDIAVLSTWAHEFQHLINYNQKVIRDGAFPPETTDARFFSNTDTLFNEGQSVLAEDLNGFSLKIAGNKGNDFLFNAINNYQSELSVSTDSFFAYNGGKDYGKGYLFSRFIYDTYGEAVLKIATHSNLIQPKNIEFATGKDINVILQEFLLALMQTDSSQPIKPNIKISTINRAVEYFGTKGESLGMFSPLGYIHGFTGGSIISESTYVVKLYKLTPLVDEVSFTLSNIKKASNYSISTALINR